MLHDIMIIKLCYVGIILIGVNTSVTFLLCRDQPWLTRQFSTIVYTMRKHVNYKFPNVSMSVLTSPRYQIAHNMVGGWGWSHLYSVSTYRQMSLYNRFVNTAINGKHRILCTVLTRSLSTS